MFQQPSSFSGGGQSTPSGSSFLEKARTWASGRPMFSLVAAIVLGSVVMSVPMSSALTGLANLQKQSADAAGYILQVDPTPVKVCSGKTAQVSVSWAVPDVGSYEVRRGSASGIVVGRATGGGKVSISDAMDGENFYLLPGYSLLNKTSLRVSTTVLASASVVFTTQGCSGTTPPVTTSCTSTGILGVSATASRSLSTNPPSLAVDGRVDTYWNSGAFPTQYIQLDLGNSYNVTGLCVNAAQLPAGVTYHDISAGSSVSTLRTVAVLNESLPIDQWKYVPVVANGTRFVKINTTSSPSWVAWNEIKVFGTLSGGDAGVCPAASVVAKYAGLFIGDKMSFDSSMPQDFNTLSFTSSNSAVVSVSGTGGVVTGYGTASISGQGFSMMAGQFCPLAPTTITVTPTAPGPSSGSLSPAGSHTITYCTNNGTSQGAPVQVSASVTSGFGKIVVTGNSVGLEPYPMQFGPGQPWTKNVEAGNIVIANGQTTGSITISLVDFYSDSHVLGSVTIVRENKNCTPTPPTGTITPGNSTVSTCGGSGSVVLVPSISSGLGRVVIGSISREGGNGYYNNFPDNIWVRGGEVHPGFTISAGNMSDRTGVTFNIIDENGNYVQGAGAVVYRDDRNCGTTTAPQGSITFAAEGLLQGHELYLCPGTQTSVSASATANVASTLSVGNREAALGNVGTNSWRGGMSFRVDAPGNGVISSYAAVLRPAVFGNDLASEVVSVHGSNSKCAAQTGTGSVAVQLPNTSGDYAACAPEGLNTYVNVVINSYNTSPYGGRNLVFSADGAVLQPGQSHQYTDAVLIRPNDSILKTYNLTDNGTVVAYDSITIRGIACGTLTASPANVVVYFGTVGFSNISATNNSSGVMHLSGDGVDMDIAAGGHYDFYKQVVVGDAPRVYTLSQGINTIAQVTVTVEKNFSK